MWFKKSAGLITNPRIYTSYREPITSPNGSVWVKPDFPNGTCLIIGHRGSSENYPENTMLAFRQAVLEGAGGIELDVRQTSDGEFCVMHDSTVDRTTNGSGSVSGFTLDDITQLDAGAWRGVEFAGRPDTKVPSLDEVLEEFGGTDTWLMLNTYLPLAVLKQLVDLLDAQDILHQCMIFTDQSHLMEVKQHNDRVFVLNSGTQHDTGNLLSRAVSEGWDAISSAPETFTPEVITKAASNRVLTQGSAITNNYATKTAAAIYQGLNLILGDDCAAMVDVAYSMGVTQIKPRHAPESVLVWGQDSWIETA